MNSTSAHRTVSSARASTSVQLASGTATQRVCNGSVMSALIVKPITPWGPYGRCGSANHLSTGSS